MTNDTAGERTQEQEFRDYIYSDPMPHPTLLNNVARAIISALRMVDRRLERIAKEK